MSTPSSQKTILITGANRGIGLSVAKTYLSLGWKVIAGVRDVSTFPKVEEGDIVVVKIDSGSLTDAKTAVEELKTKHGITHLNSVLANAGISGQPSLARDIDPEELELVSRVNVRGPLVLFQAVRELLEPGGTFAAVSSQIGSNSPEHWPQAGVYGTSKAAINFLMRSIHFEEPSLTVFTIHPGWVDTDMGNSFGTPPQKLSETGPALAKLINGATREEHGGYMWN
ncbi:hypothetical protein IAT38_005532 [Cryptococcus sp. DSM 104549]